MATTEENLSQARQVFAKSSTAFLEQLEKSLDFLNQKVTEKSVIQLRPIAVTIIRSVMLTLFNYYWINEKSQCREQISQIKELIVKLSKEFGDIDSYSIVSYSKLMSDIEEAHELSSDAIAVPQTYDSSDPEREFLIAMTQTAFDDIKNSKQRLSDYFNEYPPQELVRPLDKEIPRLQAEDTRKQLKLSKEILSSLSGEINNINEAEDSMKKLRVYVSTILGMAPESTNEPVIIAFNEMKNQVEQSFVTNGATTAAAECERCTDALEAAFQAMNPANELRQQLKQFPNDDPRVQALIPILDYLDENGPLYQGSQSQIDIHRFIMQMSLAQASTLVEIAFNVESHAPENLRHLSEICDPCKDLYKEVEGDLDIHQLADQAKASSTNAVTAATNLRQSVRDFERECSKQYRQLNTYLWRVLRIFKQFAMDEQPDTENHKNTFNMCREAIKVLIEEAAFDMKRDRTYLPFIKEFIACINKITEDPHCAEYIGQFIEFLMSHQMHRGFHDAAKSFNEYNHIVLCNDSDRAARQLISDSIKEYEFKSTSLMISQIKQRLITVQQKIDLAMKAKRTIDIRRSHIDLRQDYALFIRKFNENLFIVFTQMVAAKSRNQAAIQSLATGVEAIEKLLPLVMNIEYPAPYLARSVCGIVTYSMDALDNDAKQVGGKSYQCTTDAGLAIREFLFNVRRKIAEEEKEEALKKTGIGIPDMMAVIDRETRAINAAATFQRAIRKQKWKYQ